MAGARGFFFSYCARPGAVRSAVSLRGVRTGAAQFFSQKKKRKSHGGPMDALRTAKAALDDGLISPADYEELSLIHI